MMDSSMESGSSSEFTPPSSPARPHPVSPSTPPLPNLSSSSSTNRSSSPEYTHLQNLQENGDVSRTTLIRTLNPCDSSSDEEICTVRSSAMGTHQTFREQEVIPPHDICNTDSSSSDDDIPSESSSGNSINDVPLVNSSDSEAELSDYLRTDEVSMQSECDSESSEDDFLFEGSNLTTNEAILKTLKIYISQRKTKTCLNADVKLTKSLLPQPNSFPSSAKQLLKKLESCSPFQKEVAHMYFLGCHREIVAGNDECICGCDETCLFYEFPIEDQIRHMFEHRELAALINSYKARVPKDNYVSDIVDGCEYRRIKSTLTGHYDLVLMLNTDGVKLAKSSKMELWGLLSVICEIHPKHRLPYLIFHGVFVSTKKPKMNIFLKPFVASMKSIYLNGGVSWTHPAHNTVQKSNIVCPILCTDAPATALVLNVKSFSHRYGCNICEQKAVKVKISEPEINEQEQRGNANQKTKKKVCVRRFVYQEEPAALRSGLRMDLQADLAEARNKPRKGVVGRAVVSDLPYFQRGISVCAEYMHTVLLGAVKYLANKILIERGPWYIGKYIKEIDNFIKSVKVPDFISRLPRGLDDILYFKASELRALLLFYSLPAFKPYLPKKYFQHWMLLVAAIHLLLKDSISNEEINVAEVMLRCFVRDVGTLYHNKFYTYNMHNLLHLPLLVRRWGPLWATSAFDFESYIGYITSHVHGTKHLDKEFLNNIKIIQSVVVFERLLQNEKNPATVNDKAALDEVKILGIPLSSNILDQFEKLTIEQNGILNFDIFNR
ncbi:Receptor-like kinase TMK4, partial [Frankliniella fusca]